MLAALGVWAFVWSVKSGQFDDVETPGMRVLFDDELQEPSKSDETEQINS
jgi:cbb3-type cytochrome oxidase maturation protein